MNMTPLLRNGRAVSVFSRKMVSTAYSVKTGGLAAIGNHKAVDRYGESRKAGAK